MTRTKIHATCVAIHGRAVLIGGPSGAGKSDLALRLIDRGATLVSDDYTDLDVSEGGLVASPPDNIAGMIEVRGVGLLAKSHRACAPVALLVDLDGVPERLPEPRTVRLCGVAIPAISLNGLEPSAPIKLEAALSLYGLALPCPR